MNTDIGYLELILGPMFSGKTSKLTTIYKKHKLCGNIPLVVNHSLDNRYSFTGNELHTHDKYSIPCISINKLQDISDEIIDNHKIILINEGQFFEDIITFVNLLLCLNLLLIIFYYLILFYYFFIHFLACDRVPKLGKRESAQASKRLPMCLG